MSTIILGVYQVIMNNVTDNNYVIDFSLALLVKVFFFLKCCNYFAVKEYMYITCIVNRAREHNTYYKAIMKHIIK